MKNKQNIFTLIEMIDLHSNVSSPISIKYKYELANQDAISFD